MVDENVKTETDLKIWDEGKEDHDYSQQNQVEQFYCQLLGQEKGDSLSNLKLQSGAGEVKSASHIKVWNLLLAFQHDKIECN